MVESVHTLGHVVVAGRIIDQGSGPIGHVVVACGVGVQCEVARAQVIAAGRVVQERLVTIRQIGVASAVRIEGVGTVGRILTAGGIVKQRKKPRALCWRRRYWSRVLDCRSLC